VKGEIARDGMERKNDIFGRAVPECVQGVARKCATTRQKTFDVVGDVFTPSLSAENNMSL
jgi:hypothetical protein